MPLRYQGGTGTGEIDVFDTKTFSPVSKLTGTNAVGIATSPDGAYLYAGSISLFDASKSSVQKFDLATHRIVAQLPLNSNAFQSLALSPAGDMLYVGGAQSIVFLRAADLTVQRTVAGCEGSVVLAPDGSTLYTTAPNGAICQIDTATATITRMINSPGPTLYLASITPDGQELYFLSPSSNILIALNLATLAQTTITTQADVSSVAF